MNSPSNNPSLVEIDQKVLSKVQESIIEILGVDDDEVKPSSMLGRDLGTESIDMLGIVFILEEKFQIEIPRLELFPEDILYNEECLKNDHSLNKTGKSRIKERMPWADLTNLIPMKRKGSEDSTMSWDIDVEFLCHYIQYKLSLK